MKEYLFEEKLTLYTWHDIERILYLNKKEWPEEWIGIDVYSTELVIYAERNTSKTDQFLKALFKEYYESGCILIGITNTKILISTEVTERQEHEEPKPFPLFRDFLYVNQSIETSLPKLPGVPVLAFHSYKGGVGRTISLITFVRDVIEEYGGEKRVLVIDGDIEAPGLTWLGIEQGNTSPISYIDILSVIAAKGNDDEIIKRIAGKAETSSLIFKTRKMEISHFFIPTYREESQLLDIYANPERIMAGEDNKYIIAEVLSKIGAELGVCAVLVDLRAGISEYSAPLLFDPRVGKYLVSSTSYQSVVGTNMLLRELRKQSSNNIVNIFLTKVQKEIFNGTLRNDIYQQLLNGNEISGTTDVENDLEQMDSIIELDYNDSLNQLGSLDQICDKLNNVGKVTDAIKRVVLELLSPQKGNKYTSKQISSFRHCLGEITSNNINAENADLSNMLETKSVAQLGNFTKELPKINILGAKGSGKTYLYAQLTAAKSWEQFINHITKTNVSSTKCAAICPVLCSEDRAEMQKLLIACQEACSAALKIEHDKFRLSNHANKLRDELQYEKTENEWIEIWKNIIMGMFPGVSAWEELNSYLASNGVIFIFDGLENIFNNLAGNVSHKNAIRALCRGIINQLYEAQADNIGIIVFLRKDMAELAINNNFEQFRHQYKPYELTWSKKEALQLAWKLCRRAAGESGIELKEDVSIMNASQEVFEENMTQIWGLKMGDDTSRTAYTIRWVMASLSDFKGQLQARDIVRFLMEASKDEMKGKEKYYDRFLSPTDLKKAIQEASAQKLKEVRDEISQLKEIFDILAGMDTKDKQVPLNARVMAKLDANARKTLEMYGYLREADGEFYIPENIRYALDYNKTKRGGIKLVSLLVN